MVKSAKVFFKGEKEKSLSLIGLRSSLLAFLFCCLNKSAEILFLHSAVFPFGFLALRVFVA